MVTRLVENWKELVCAVNEYPFSVAVVYWSNEPDEMLLHMWGTFEALGCHVYPFNIAEKTPPGVDYILAIGPFGSLAPLYNQYPGFPDARQPGLILWMTEQLPNPAVPEALRYLVGVARSNLERMAYQENFTKHLVPNHILSWMGSRAHRYRYYGDLFWLRQTGMLKVLAVGSQWIATYLTQRGFDPVVAYIGSHPGWGSDLVLERDIPVIWIGKLATDRRKKVLSKLRHELRQHGVDIWMVDGIEHPTVFGDQRTLLLNRSRIVVNVLREKWDNHSLRYFLAAQNHNLIVSEPTLQHTPFKPGIHLIQAETGALAGEILHFLSYPEKSHPIIQAADDLVTHEITMANSVRRILQKAALK